MKVDQIFINGGNEGPVAPDRPSRAACTQRQRRLKNQAVKPAVGEAGAKADSRKGRRKLKARRPVKDESTVITMKAECSDGRRPPHTGQIAANRPGVDDPAHPGRCRQYAAHRPRCYAGYIDCSGLADSGQCAKLRQMVDLIADAAGNKADGPPHIAGDALLLEISTRFVRQGNNTRLTSLEPRKDRSCQSSRFRLCGHSPTPPVYIRVY